MITTDGKCHKGSQDRKESWMFFPLDRLFGEGITEEVSYEGTRSSQGNTGVATVPKNPDSVLWFCWSSYWCELSLRADSVLFSRSFQLEKPSSSSWFFYDNQPEPQGENFFPWKSETGTNGLRPQILWVQFSCPVMSNSLQLHGLQHTRPPCLSPIPGVYTNSCPLSWWCQPIISSSLVPFSSCLQSFPASGSFQMSQLFTSGA